MLWPGWWVDVLMCGVVVGMVLLLVWMCADPESPGCCGRISAAVDASCVRGRVVAERICGRTVYGVFARAFRYVFQEANPLLKLFYLALVFGGYAVFTVFGHPLLAEDSVHRVLPVVLIASCLAALYIVTSTSPGIITSANVHHYMNAYAFDNVLSRADCVCPTCHFVKPARSKHCSLCKACVARSDHHCYWLNTCIGQHNHRYFVLFLVTNLMLTSYGSWLLFSLMRDALVSHGVFQHFARARIDVMSLLYWQRLTQFVLYHFIHLWALWLLLSCVTIVFALFLVYHTLLAVTNSTSNERAKRSDVARGRNVHIGYEAAALLVHVVPLETELASVQRRLLELDPRLAQQNPKRTEELQRRRKSTGADDGDAAGAAAGAVAEAEAWVAAEGGAAAAATAAAATAAASAMAAPSSSDAADAVAAKDTVKDAAKEADPADATARRKAELAALFARQKELVARITEEHEKVHDLYTAEKERVERVRAAGHVVNVPNAYDRGVWRNVWEFVFPPPPPRTTPQQQQQQQHVQQQQQPNRSPANLAKTTTASTSTTTSTTTSRDASKKQR